MSIHQRTISIIFILLFTTSCASHSVQLVNQGNITSQIDMDSYIINFPDVNSWKDWAATKDTDSDTLSIEKLKVWPITGEVMGVSNITIVKDNITSIALLDLELNEIAHKIMDAEMQTMNEEGVQKGQYQLEDISRETTDYNGKKLYIMRYKVKTGSALAASFKRSMFSKAALYIYFPDNFQTTHTFYRFLINEYYIPGTLIKVDTDQILPIINNFKLTTNKKS